MQRITPRSRIHRFLIAALLILGTIAAAHAGDGKPSEPAPLFTVFEP